MSSLLLSDLSRLQFAFTALFHFLFVPLTLGLTWILVAMEAAYVKTGKAVYKDMTRFWGKLLAINFAIGVLSGITMEFEFGLNWAYFSRMIGGSFGPVLAIEGITAFMLEATMFGLFFFGWDKLSHRAHFLVTFFMAVGATLSIVNILAANSWMQHPVATSFNYRNMTLELGSIADLYLQPLSQLRIGHVAFAGFLVASMFVIGISAFYLLKNRDVEFAKRSFAIATGFGLVCSLIVAFYGDQNGLAVSREEPEKMAAIEAQWTTQKAPAAWYLFAWPDQTAEQNKFEVKIPDALSIIATHSLTGTVEGIKPLIAKTIPRVKNGMIAYAMLHKIWNKTATPADMIAYQKNEKDLGFGYLLKPFTEKVTDATPAQIIAAAKSAIPDVQIAFWSFRIMIALWAIVTLLIFLGFIFALRDTLQKHRFFLRCCVYAIPLPFMTAESGWVLAEVGRQPWVIHNIMPTFMGISTLDVPSLITSLIFFVVFYIALITVELCLMFKFARLGPSSLGTKKYFFEVQ
ncbi:MAG: cytochrome d terminal oxidase subunit 1 [Gammaproteobacteria bacterium RIFCSPLOWO2_02_FULL_42_14]|nr:MAG: cytochrome d terminal oxidase subunit 1 [Gammaproteobacteria bacterium RIFCSPHIGHO2_02_FULL_42_43]OGT51217.1 MAG: cytochrome d terminal oxidase subunit 1 [Gammaproteobacteria bacterium RIFCSPHIGHO2_12_FULL_41_25]OGT62978.1 MAG: cytochrome d terminal oxidase subunit 1 [Gammaproteobacteria bacterium RIFCSPLOWO2_02_FULL_42_14]OGT86111.1 MAG: cytochrome d terminal oxidase subunit 1 [Gammaproteobacteria bacterium RIFCSPLOWO2_12_FULL_42_18]